MHTYVPLDIHAHMHTTHTHTHMQRLREWKREKQTVYMYLDLVECWKPHFNRGVRESDDTIDKN